MKVLNHKTRLACLLTASLALSTPHAFARGGDSSGGGSSLGGKLLDTRVRENSVDTLDDEEVRRKLSRMQNIFIDAMPEFGDAYVDFFYNGANKKRFVLAEKLPEAKDGDAKHQAGDALIGLQRGPNIWVQKDWYQSAPAAERFEFFLHEFFVGEKLKNGSLSEKDKEEVLHVNARILEMYGNYLNAENPTGVQVQDEGRLLQGLLEANGFRSGLTSKEQRALISFGTKLEAAIKKACEGKRVNQSAMSAIKDGLRYAKAVARDDLNSQAKRRRYSEIAETIEAELKDEKNFCSNMREIRRADQLRQEAETVAAPPEAPTAPAAEAAPRTVEAPVTNADHEATGGQSAH